MYVQVARRPGASGRGLLQPCWGDPPGATPGEAGVWAGQVRDQDCGFPLCEPLPRLCPCKHAKHCHRLWPCIKLDSNPTSNVPPVTPACHVIVGIPFEPTQQDCTQLFLQTEMYRQLK